MPPKRAREPRNDALTYWVAALPDIPQSARGGRRNSFEGELILDAHCWGEAMVRAHLQNLAGNGVPADRRRNVFEDRGRQWYALGYRYWFLPNSEGAPADIVDFLCKDRPYPNASADTLAQEAARASETWWKRFAGVIRCEVEGVVQREAHARVAVAPSAPRPVKRQIVALSPATTIAVLRAGPPLPGRLQRLLDHPADVELNAPHPGIGKQVADALKDLRMLRVWTNTARTGRELSSFAISTWDLQRALDKRGLSVVYGGGRGPGKQDAERLKRAGLGECANGTFNTIWAVKNEASAQWVKEVLPAELAVDFLRRKLVLRIPLGSESGGWLSKEEAIGEATNMLFTALLHCGPRVGALGFARRDFRDKTSPEEGARVVRYKLYAFLERATRSVDQRYVPPRAMCSHVVDNKPYYEALLVAVFQISAQGFVHLDATLRNFVDFYGDTVPDTLGPFAIKVIDVEAHIFRRLCPSQGTEWRYLFLFNLLVVLVFLKLRLAAAWIPSIHWMPVKRMCKQLLSELDGKDNLAARLLWEGPFQPDGAFPNLAEGVYAGDTPVATAEAARQQLQHYLLQEPLDLATSWYYNVAFAEEGHEPTAQKFDEACTWFDKIYCGQMVPVRTFFLDALRPHDEASRFVDVAYRFLDTPLGDITRRFPSTLRLSKRHLPGDGREAVLGLE